MKRPASDELTDAELAELDGLLARVEGGRIPNTEALDGFFAALACCPEMVMPSEYLPVIQRGETDDGDLDFKSMEEANRFMELISQHWNHVNHQLNEEELYIPLALGDEPGSDRGSNDWANGFITGTHLRHGIWSELIEDEENGGPIVPIMALAYENHPDPEMRPFKEPIDDEKRQELMIGSAAGVMQMHAYFLEQRDAYLPEVKPTVRTRQKTGRNAPCPCGSGLKYKKCCGSPQTLH
ncbi:MAG: UPF0149 family protein [Geminicoccaceae bacterium]